MDLNKLIAEVVQVAKTASLVLPQAGLAEEGIAIGGRIIDLVNSLKSHAESPAELDAARHELENTVGAKAAATSAGLRGQ